jgi:hypothetical protein
MTVPATDSVMALIVPSITRSPVAKFQSDRRVKPDHGDDEQNHLLTCCENSRQVMSGT